MYLSDEQNKAFLGIYEKNANGESLGEFLEKYDPTEYQNPCATVDTLVFAKEGNNLTKVLLIRRGNHPCIGMWALPGGFVEYRENLKDAALRELREETAIDNIDAIQLKCYGDYDRDPRTRIITTAFASIVDEKDVIFKAGDDAADCDFFDINVKDMGDDVFSLTLSSENFREEIQAEIKVKKTVICGVEDFEYETIRKTNLSADHGSIILESYQYLMSKLQ